MNSHAVIDFVPIGGIEPPIKTVWDNYLLFIRVTIPTIINMNAINDKGIHTGAVTHHQDQSITFVSFRTTNTIVNNPVNPIPEFVVFVSLIALSINFYKYLSSFQSIAEVAPAIKPTAKKTQI